MDINETFKKLASTFPKSEPIPPSQLAVGIAEQLRDMAAQIETGDLVITHFSFTTHHDPHKQRLEIEVA